MLPIIGFVRFSLVMSKTLGNFSATRGKSLARAESVVLNEERLKRRLALFEQFCLPSLRTLTDRHDSLSVFILTSAAMPGAIHRALEEMTSECAHIRIVRCRSEGHVKDVAREIVKDCVKAGEYFTFRIDDDDALSVRYVDNLMRLYPLENLKSVLSFAVGYGIFRVSDEKFCLSQKTYRANAFGLGSFASASFPTTIFDFGNHVNLQKNEVLYCSMEPGMWLSPIYGENDSLVRQPSSILRLGRQKRILTEQ